MKKLRCVQIMLGYFLQLLLWIGQQKLMFYSSDKLSLIKIFAPEIAPAVCNNSAANTYGLVAFKIPHKFKLLKDAGSFFSFLYSSLTPLVSICKFLAIQFLQDLSSSCFCHLSTMTINESTISSIKIHPPRKLIAPEYNYVPKLSVHPINFRSVSST